MKWLPIVRLGIVAAVFWLGWKLRAMTVPLLGAYLLMLICLPWRQRWKKKIGNIPATLACILSLLVLPVVFLLPVLLEAGSLMELLPSQQEEAQAREWSQKYVAEPLRDFVNSLPAGVAEKFQTAPDSETIDKVGPKIAQVLGSMGSSLASFFGGLFGIASSLILLPIFLFYLLEGAPWLPRIRSEIPKSWRPSFDRSLPKIQKLLRTYCRARLVVAIAKGAVAWLILMAFGVPGAYTLGLLLGAASLLPVIGPLVSTVILLVICVRVHGGSGLVLAGGIYVFTELLEGYVLLPRLVGRELGMSDFVVILALLGGGALMGFFGLLIAIPAVAIAQVLWSEYVRPLMRDPEHQEAESAPID